MDLKSIIEQDKKFHLNVYGPEGKRFFPDVLVVKGEDVTVTDHLGKEYFDFTSGISVVNVGHNNPKIEENIGQRLAEYKKKLGLNFDLKLTHLSNLFYILPQSDCAQAISEIVPINGAHPDEDPAKIFFDGGPGAGATNSAIKLAALNEGYWLFGIDGTFLARHGAALAATGQKKFHKRFEKTLPGNVKHIKFNNMEDLKQITQDTYAVITEVILGEGGVIPAEQDYIDALRTRCNETKTLLIVDEVQTGFGRTGKMFASEHYGLKPDAICMAKGIANGYPFSAVAFSPDFAGMVEPYMHASTFGGNAEGCLRTMAVLDIIREDNLLENAVKREEQFYSIDFPMDSQDIPPVTARRGKGLLLAVDLEKDINRMAVINKCKEEGYLFCGCGDNAIRIAPPLTITEECFGEGMKTLKNSISYVLNSNNKGK